MDFVYACACVCACEKVLLIWKRIKPKQNKRKGSTGRSVGVRCFQLRLRLRLWLGLQAKWTNLFFDAQIKRNITITKPTKDYCVIFSSIFAWGEGAAKQTPLPCPGTSLLLVCFSLFFFSRKSQFFFFRKISCRLALDFYFQRKKK